jgi:hypothetical protein
MKVKSIIIILVFLYSLNEIKSDPLWEINFYSDNDEPSNEFNLTRGNYKTIKFKLKNLQESANNIQHFKRFNNKII